MDFAKTKFSVAKQACKFDIVKKRNCISFLSSLAKPQRAVLCSTAFWPLVTSS